MPVAPKNNIIFQTQNLKTISRGHERVSLLIPKQKNQK